MIGLSLGLLGGGGSILAVPVLVYVLRFPMKEAVPMSLVVVGITSAFGALNHHRQKNLRWDAALAFGPAAMAGAYLGTRIARQVSSRAQLTIFAVLMVAAALSMFFGSTWLAERERGAPGRRRPIPAIVALGATVGALTGLVGVGGGFLYVPALVLLGGVAMKQAVGTSLLLIILSCVSGFVGYLGMIAIDWGATALFAALAVVGVLIGSRLVARFSPTGLRRGFAVLLVIIGLVVLLKPR